MVLGSDNCKIPRKGKECKTFGFLKRFPNTQFCKMPLLKVWDAGRKIKKFVKADSVEALIQKGMQKLGFEQVTVDGHRPTVVLETDGTNIDEDDILEEITGQVVLLLKPGESWEPPEPTTEPTTPRPPAEAAVPSPNTALGSSGGSDMLSEKHTPVTSPTVSLGEAEDHSVVHQKLKSAPPPKFSAFVCTKLQQCCPQPVWNTLIAEAAEYYFSMCPKIGDQRHYDLIGQTVYARYPGIKLEGSRPWSTFTKCLSQKIRHMRHRMKSKSQDGPAQKKRKVFRVLDYSTQTPCTISPGTEEEVQGFVNEIKKVWAKPAASRDKKHLQVLLRHTKEYRTKLLVDTPSGRIEPIMREFPCFEDSSYLLYDLTLLVGGKKKVEQMALNMKKVMFAGEELMGTHQEGRLRMWPVIKYIEKETAYERGGGKGKKGQASRRTLKTMPIIEVKQDISEDQIEKELKTEEGSAPHLIAFVSSQEDSLQGMYIVGDTVKISVPVEGGIMCGVLKLFASYYVFDLQYPRQHAMVMAILQTFLTDEPYRGATNQKYKFFVEKFRKAFKKLPDPEPMSKD